MRLHLVALCHVRLGTPDTHLCAYSGKILKFIRMMGKHHQIVLYCPESDPLPNCEMVECLSDIHRQKTFGPDDANRLPAWPTDDQFAIFNHRACAALRQNYAQGDLILLSAGYSQRSISQSFQGPQYCEPFVGYDGVLGGNIFAAFESYAHMNSVYRRWDVNDIRWFDCVIPPFVDIDEFPTINGGTGDYLLFVGRLIPRKGAHVALEIAKRCGMKLVVAGSGGRTEGGVLYGQDVRLEGNIEYVGPVGIQDRATLMAGAKAFICPTIYFEPGGNVAIEAMMAGTPVIAPDSGVFAETVKHGLSGFHFRMLRDGVDAVHDCAELNPFKIRDYAIDNFSLAATRPKYEKWFADLQTLATPVGWYAT